MGSDSEIAATLSKQGNDPVSFLLDKLKSLGAAVTAIVGLASTLFACSADNIKRNDAFSATVAAHEKQWQSLYDQYFAALAAKDDEGGLREKRLLSICQFSNRNIPNFEEHRLGYFWLLDHETRQKEAHDQLDRLKTGLRTALATDGIGTAKSAECVKNQRLDQEEDSRNERQRVSQDLAQAGPQLVSAIAQTETANRVKKTKAILKQARATAIAPVTSTLTLASGDPRGYDIDVFWCVASDDQLMREHAGRVAEALSQSASLRSKIAGLFRVGRVRLRPLAIEKQVGGGYPSSGLEVRGDPYERQIAAALVQYLNGQPEIGPFVGFESGLDTKWYLSIFVCS